MLEEITLNMNICLYCVPVVLELLSIIYSFTYILLNLNFILKCLLSSYYVPLTEEQMKVNISSLLVKIKLY